ncbi:hypothetical protein BDF14DRAFT_221055 [Spinellus fusiger]|nr:hypothetical protein BDF14DRAFT_221055 [Spinellus fusiger]
MNIICALLGALEVIDGRKWLLKLRYMNSVKSISFSTQPLQMAVYFEIALSVLLALFAIGFAYLSFEVVKEFGWAIYKKIGADVDIQSKSKACFYLFVRVSLILSVGMYKIFQFFVLALKFDIFIEFLVSCFYLVQFTTRQYDPVWEIWFQLGVTALILPMLYFARMAGSSESWKQMLLFIVFQNLVVVQFVLVLRQTLTSQNFWYTWICFIILGIILALVTATLGGICMYNFNKGLDVYVQRGAKKYKQSDSLELSKHSSGTPWMIDDE